MKIILHEDRQYVLKFILGEEVIVGLKQFCTEEQITSAFFQGLGACTDLKLAYYNLETKQYEEHEYHEDLELANITGNVSVSGQDLIIHMHGTFGPRDMAAIAGHVVSMTVGGTCEIFLTKFETSMHRAPDTNTGLKLLE